MKKHFLVLILLTILVSSIVYAGGPVGPDEQQTITDVSNVAKGMAWTDYAVAIAAIVTAIAAVIGIFVRRRMRNR